jgi:putative ABC transport system permease protein
MMHTKVTVLDGGTNKEFDSREEGGSLPSIVLTTPDYFKIFTFSWLAGNPEGLNEPNRVIISEKVAKKYFGPIPPREIVGKQLMYNDDRLVVTITGVVEDWAGNTDLPFNEFISLSSVKSGPLRGNTNPKIGIPIPAPLKLS